MLHGETRGGCAAQRGGVAAERCAAGGGAYRQQLAADHRQGVGSIGAGDHRQGVAASGRRDPLAGRGQHRGGRSPAGRGQHRGGAIPWQGAAAAGSRSHRQDVAAAGSRSHRQGVAAAGSRSPPGRGSIGAARSPGRAWQQLAGDHRQGVAAAGGRSPAGRGQQLAADHRQQGGQGLKAAKSSHAKDESPTGILSTHIRVAAEKNFFTPRRGVIWGEKRPFPARGRKPCYDFCVGRESPPAKQKLHSADHGAERISP